MLLLLQQLPPIHITVQQPTGMPEWQKAAIAAGIGALFGICGALAVVSKFSVLPYFAVAAILSLVCYRLKERPTLNVWHEIRRRAPSLALAAAVAFAIIWGVYRFSFGKVFFADIKLPAPELFAGVRDVLAHNARGHA